MTLELDTFTLAYIEAALWSSHDDEGRNLDLLYSVDDIAPETLETMIADCRDFQETNQIPEYGCPRYSDAEKAGHDFWLTRNGHGAGFWDRGLPEDVSKHLTEMSHAYGGFDLYVGDDGKIHGA